MSEHDGINVTSGNGAQLEPVYHHNKQSIVGVPVMDLREASSSAVEEVAQFSVGGFLASGAFWLGVERLVTEGGTDALFLACIAFFICGGVLALTGFRQSLRRVRRLERYIPQDDNAS